MQILEFLQTLNITLTRRLSSLGNKQMSLIWGYIYLDKEVIENFNREQHQFFDLYLYVEFSFVKYLIALWSNTNHYLVQLLSIE